MTEPRITRAKAAALLKSASELNATNSIQSDVADLSISQNHSFSPFQSCPFEILVLIFLRVIPPSYILDSSTWAGPRSAWWRAMETKRMLSLVCRSWYSVGIGFLYEDVTFHWLHQVPVFLRTLEGDPEMFGKHVRRISLYAFVPNNYGSSFGRYIQRIVDLCPSVTLFDVSCPIRLPENCQLPSLPLSVVHLRVTLPFSSPEASTKLLSHIGHRLCSLSIVINDKEFDVLVPELSLSFPRLETLLLNMTPDSLDQLESITRLFSMPALRSLTFKACFWSNGQDESGRVCEALATFLDRFGRNLQFLHVYSSPRARWPEGVVQRFLDACPTLEHLALKPFPAAFNHRSVKWLDFWAGHSDSITEGWLEKHWKGRPHVLSKSNTELPNLKGFRLLQTSLTYLWCMPFFLPPDLELSEDGVLELEFPGIFIRHQAGLVGGQTCDAQKRHPGCSCETIQETSPDSEEATDISDDSDLDSEVSESSSGGGASSVRSLGDIPIRDFGDLSADDFSSEEEVS